PKYSAISSSSRFSKSSFRAWRAIGLKSPSHSNPLISPIARDTFLSVACSSSIGVPSSCLCWSHNSGVSTPSVFSQSKNDLGLTLNHLSIVCPRPNVKAILFPFPFSPPNLHTDSYITQRAALFDISPRFQLCCRRLAGERSMIGGQNLKEVKMALLIAVLIIVLGVTGC